LAIPLWARQQATVKEKQLQKRQALVPNAIWFEKWHASLKAFSWHKATYFTARLAHPVPPLMPAGSQLPSTVLHASGTAPQLQGFVSSFLPSAHLGRKQARGARREGGHFSMAVSKG